MRLDLLLLLWQRFEQRLRIRTYVFAIVEPMFNYDLFICEETSYVPTGNLDLDLERLTEKSDGFLDEVHSLRDQYGADIVTLLSTDSSSGGLANTKFSHILFEDKAFNVVFGSNNCPGYTLVHEIGHNMGCLHNREDADLTKQCIPTYDYGKFAYGKRWFVGSDGYRTVMSYNDDASSYRPIPHISRIRTLCIPRNFYRKPN